MYRVTVENNKKEYVLHDVNAQEEKLWNTVWNEEMGKTPTFSFSISPDHPYIDQLHPLTSKIRIYRVGEQEPEFSGRIVSPALDIQNINTVQCVGALSYLADSIQGPFIHTGNAESFLQAVLDVHNRSVDEEKQIKLGKVNVTIPITERAIEGYTDSLTLLQNALVSQYGGYLRAREVGETTYLDYLIDYGGVNSQEIRFGENVLDITRQIDAASIITILIPEGGSVDVTLPDGTTESRVVDITSVNSGKNYIQNDEAIKKWGKIWGYANFQDITNPQTLLTEAKKYLQKKTTLPETVNLTAMDLSLIDVDIERLKVGLWTRFYSWPHDLEGLYLIQKLERHLDATHNDRVVFGNVEGGISQSTVASERSVTVKLENVKKITSKEIENKVNNATNLITGGLGGYIVIGRNEEDGHPEEILIMDAPTKETAKNVIRLNRNGIGFSNDGYNGTYRNAWTIDGNLVADFVTTGTMLADRIRGGTLELGGTGLGKDGSIIVMDAAGKKIGSWDKTGLAILRGILQGVSATFGGVDNQNGALEVLDASGRRIGRWDKDGLDITKGRLRVGPFEVYSDAVSFGDFEVTSDGSNELRSSNGHVRINSNDKPSGSPGGDYATMYIGGDGYEGVNINGGSGYVRCGEFYALNCQLAHGDRLWGLGETIDWMWDEIKSRFDDVWSHINAAGRSGE